MRVLSLNLWNINPPVEHRMSVLDQHLKKEPYDLLIFQEVSPVDNGQLQVSLLSATEGMVTIYQETGSWLGRAEGLAVVSRFPVRAVRFDRLPRRDSDMDRGLMHVTVRTPTRDVHVFNTHLAFRPEDEDLRLLQSEVIVTRVKSLMAASPNDLVILCGDLNDVPGSPVLRLFNDIPGLASPFSGESASTNTFSSHNPYVKPELVPDRRIDHCLVSRDVSVRAGLVFSLEADPPSDHYGLALEIG